MGDFDKNRTAETPAASKRKQILVGVLGAVLLAAVAHHFLRGSPETAMAGNSANAPDPVISPLPRQTASQELRDLTNDPTRNLLQHTAALPPELAAIPHDPFQVPERFRPASNAAAVKPDPAPVDPLTHVPPPQAPAIPADSLRVEGIFHLVSKLQAIVNGNVVSVGMTVGDAQIIDIQNDRIVVRHKDWPEGPATTIILQPKSK